ncbi:hypothetical protein AVEN_186859-1 [Araneus ventricosus]|uniref:Uncharacterized protein n=1 Tax=Araneus ventricosus TaxID=182803 RepID=A0A4Y2NKJ0_ARAVE|nr:hypothetical protein AVEN_186859-1 [Araneus ventricosus]
MTSQNQTCCKLTCYLGCCKLALLSCQPCCKLKLLSGEDREFLRLLWWNIKDRSKLEFFRYCRVVLGVTSSPFLLNASIRHHLNSTEYQLEYLQTTVEKLKRAFHVDNLTTSVESQEELEQFKMQTMEIINAASFELRCWAHTGVQDQESKSENYEITSRC